MDTDPLVLLAVDVIIMENGIPFHSQVIGLPYFYRVPLSKAPEAAEPETTVSVH